MIREKLFSFGSANRQDFEIWGYRFGSGEPSVAVIAGLRGDEAQPLHVASSLVAWLRSHEDELLPGHEVLVVPAANPFSFNLRRRFWGLDDTDVNRMFPGYSAGETTQRIAAGLMAALTGYRWGVNLTSINHPGHYLSHVRLHQTGYEDLEGARAFGLPDVHLHRPNAQETGSLNYNWQIWETKAYSLVGGRAFHAETGAGRVQLDAVLRFLAYAGVFGKPGTRPPEATVWRDDDLVRVQVTRAGLFQPLVRPGDAVSNGQPLGVVSHALEGTLLETVVSPVAGRVFYVLEAPLVYAHMVGATVVPP